MIREIRPDDWQQLRDVRLRALEEAPYAFLTRYEEAAGHPDELWQERATPSGEGTSFVVDAGGRFDGLVSAFTDETPGAVYLVGMWVAPERRGSGTAAELVDRVVEWARGRGAERVLLAVEAENHRAARLYERCGFRLLEEKPAMPWQSDSPVYELLL